MSGLKLLAKSENGAGEKNSGNRKRKRNGMSGDALNLTENRKNCETGLKHGQAKVDGKTAGNGGAFVTSEQNKDSVKSQMGAKQTRYFLRGGGGGAVVSQTAENCMGEWRSIRNSENAGGGENSAERSCAKGLHSGVGKFIKVGKRKVDEAVKPSNYNKGGGLKDHILARSGVDLMQLKPVSHYSKSQLGSLIRQLLNAVFPLSGTMPMPLLAENVPFWDPAGPMVLSQMTCDTMRGLYNSMLHFFGIEFVEHKKGKFSVKVQTWDDDGEPEAALRMKKILKGGGALKPSDLSPPYSCTQSELHEMIHKACTALNLPCCSCSQVSRPKMKQYPLWYKEALEASRRKGFQGYTMFLTCKALMDHYAIGFKWRGKWVPFSTEPPTEAQTLEAKMDIIWKDANLK